MFIFITTNWHADITFEFDFFTFIFIRQDQAGNNINNNSNSNSKLNYKHLTKYYHLLQNWQKPVGDGVAIQVCFCCFLNCYKKIQVSPKIRVLRSGNCPKLWTSKNRRNPLTVVNLSLQYL